ncbi:MAG: hypothetical protein P8X39_03430 [Desulfofustis sp.]
MMDLEDEVQQLALPLLIEYGVHPEEKEQALAVYQRFKHSPVAVTLLRCYYADLPEAREEMAVDLKRAALSEGSEIIVLRSTNHDYLYLFANDQALFLGEFKDGIEDERILHHFDFKNKEDFFKQLPQHADDLPSLPRRVTESSSTCVACGVGSGEKHIFGCPVEPCPWCHAQLSGCNCRFDKLGLDAIEEEHQLDQFEELLERKGRIVFSVEQNPSYPTAGNDPPPFRDEKGE